MTRLQIHEPPAGGERGERTIHVRMRPRTAGLRFTRGDREFTVPRAAFDGPKLADICDPATGRHVAWVAPSRCRAGGGRGMRRCWSILLSDWGVGEVATPRDDASESPAPAASVAAGPGPAEPGESRDGGMLMNEAENFTGEVKVGPIERATWRVLGRLWWVILAAAVVLALGLLSRTFGQEPRRWEQPVYYRACPGGTCPQPRSYAAQYTPAARGAGASPGAGAADPLVAVNAYRARHGVRPLAWDGRAAALAAQNNAHQLRRGLGHHVTGGYGQCAGVGYRDAAHAAWGWYTSPGHRALMLSPRYTAAGLAWSGTAWTLNLR